MIPGCMRKGKKKYINVYAMFTQCLRNVCTMSTAELLSRNPLRPPPASREVAALVAAANGASLVLYALFPLTTRHCLRSGGAIK